MSTAEAEYIAISEVTKELIYVLQLMKEIGINLKTPIPVFSDSAAAISISQKPGFTQRSKSIRLEYHNVRQCERSKLIKTVKISGKFNPADILTKPLPRPQTITYATHLLDTKASLKRQREINTSRKEISLYLDNYGFTTSPHSLSG